jgi:phage-related protein
MDKIRTVVAYKDYFKDFLLAQPEKIQDKIYKIIEIIEFQQRIPEKYLKHLEGQKGLYEARITLGSNIWRVFCFFDKGKLVILLNGFQKKSKRTPKPEIEKASLLMREYYKEKK